MESWNLLQSSRYGYILDLIEDSEGLKDSDPRWDKSQITMLLLIIIGFLWYIFLLIVTIRFWKNVGLFNKWLLLSFISLNGSLICKIWFFTSTYVSFLKDWSPIDRCVFASEIFTADLLLECGVLLGLFNWCHLIIKVNNYISVIKNPIESKIKTLRLTSVIIISFLFILYIVEFVLSCNTNNANFQTIDEFF